MTASLLLATLLFSPPKATPAPPPASQGSAKAGPAGLDVVWYRTWDEAVAAAKKVKDGRILIELVDDGCGECQRMEALIVPSTSFYALMRDKVPAQLNRKSADGKRIAERFGMDKVPAPAWLVVTPDQIVCGFQAGPTNQQGWFQTFAESEKSWGAYKRRLEEESRNPADLELAFNIAQETYKRRGDAIAEPRFRRIVANAKAPLPLREQSLAYLASICMDAGRAEDAVKDLDALLAIGVDPSLREKAEFRRAEVEIARGRRDLAAGRLKEFKKAHPDSPRVAEVDALLKAMSAGDSSKEQQP